MKYKKDKIKLYFSLANCHEESTYRIEFRMIDSEDSEETFITEEKRNKLKNGTLNFSKTFTYEYDFSKIQSFKLDLKRWGQSKFTKLPIKEKYHLCLSSIISSKNSVFKTKSKENTDDCETVIISAENAENSNLEDIEYEEIAKNSEKINIIKNEINSIQNKLKTIKKKLEQQSYTLTQEQNDLQNYTYKTNIKTKSKNKNKIRKISSKKYLSIDESLA